MKFRKKPIVVEAEQWFPDRSVRGITPFRQLDPKQRDALLVILPEGELSQFAWCPTLEGGHIVSRGDWIITGVHGEKYPCKPDVFEETYEPVEEP